MIPTNLEIYFWSLLIGLLSDSELAQRVLRAVHVWIVTGEWVRTVRLVILLSGVGFLLGFILGMVGV